MTDIKQLTEYANSLIEGKLIILSSIFTYIFSFIYELIRDRVVDNNLQFTLLSMGFVLGMYYFLTSVDLITRVLVLRDKERQLNKKIIKSKPIGKTIAKMVAFLVYMLIVVSALFTFNLYNAIVMLLLFPGFLAMIREYISIGENLHEKTGKPIYLFELADKIFILVEKKFYSNLNKKMNNDED